MPITPFQKRVFQLLKSSRDPNSYVAGGTAINRDPESMRYSIDIDIFHETDIAVASAYEADLKTLAKAGYSCETIISQPSFYQVIISKNDESLKLEWVRDTAFRFFPVIEDEQMGYRLHDVDLAINKSLALASRTEIRDAIDIMQIHSKVLSLAACCWAACGKDPGFTPPLILEHIQRNSVFTPDMLASESLREPIDPVRFKKDLSAQIDRARSIVKTLPAKDIGCLYIDKDERVVKDLAKKDLGTFSTHFGSVKGSWPRYIPVD